MQSIHKQVSTLALTLMLISSLTPSAQAHLMVAQHGTLNFVDDGAFMVLSLPISAFEDADDNGDGAVSMVEFNNHRLAIVDTVRRNVRLSGKEGNLPLDGVMLSPEVPHDGPNELITQLTVLGRFALVDASSEFRFHIGLYGKQETEQRLEITATRKADNQEHVLVLTPAESAGLLLLEPLTE